MAYSMFERPKLHNVKSLKFYPEEHDHHVSFRHKNLSPNFELTVEKHKDSRRNHSLEVHSSNYKKCPIYVHSFDNTHQNEGDFVMKTVKSKKTGAIHKSVIEKLEEKYWANWKPDKHGSKSSKLPEVPVLKNEKLSDTKIIKSAPERRRKINKIPSNRSRDFQIRSIYKLQKNTSKSQEIQTDNPETLINIEATQSRGSKEESSEKSNKEIAIADESTQEEENSKGNDKDLEINPGEVLHDTKFLRHTDSLILNLRKKKETKQEERFDQPKCIRLYKKTGKLTSKNYIRGGSYPLRSCLKKDVNLNKIKLARPGSPMIVSSNYSNKSTKSHRR